jgi:hypothetical protein
MARALATININQREAEAVIDGLRGITWSLQRKYLAKAVGKVGKAKVPSVRAITPKNKGRLLRSAGSIVNKPKRRSWPSQMTSATVWGRVGYKRGKTKKGRGRGGYVSHFVEKGVKRRVPKRGKAFAIQWSKNRKYQYLKPFLQFEKREEAADGQPARRKRRTHLFLTNTKSVKGQGFFERWLNVHQKSMRFLLELELKRGAAKAISESRLRAKRRAVTAAARRLERSK